MAVLFLILPDARAYFRLGPPPAEHINADIFIPSDPEHAFGRAARSGSIPSEFDSYFDWLDLERCRLLRQLDVKTDMWSVSTLPDEYWTNFWDPKCRAFLDFLDSNCRDQKLYLEFLGFNCTLENPRRWDAMPEEYRQWRRTQFTEPRECVIADTYRNLTDSELFDKFGYLAPDAEREDPGKCEAIIWVDESDPRNVPKPSKYYYREWQRFFY
ncbi:hypothetical protein BJ508DRAFT_335945 [Ascobolus immersus RN42]|uniref:Uncharacterized protein n=1 Tax=Ascobolus immersus RN42 TaxID=1160509 RepID=A0A3N4HCY1_ASCIM|nr:hypothetical protein BJ508DRAFT_335945 [Ascobolus immersus RN42]